jgi:Ca2+-binding RTX toxin-like protein
MHGGRGNDVYIVDHSRDLVNEDEKGGRDTVLAKRSYALGENSIEVLSTFDLQSTKKINLTGDSFAQTLKGNAGPNVLKGLSGNDKLLGYSGGDILIGGDGQDHLTGGQGHDVFVFDTKPGTGIDRILDFSVKDDTIKLVGSVFSGLTPGVLLAGAFVRASSATDSDDRIIYDPATGFLSFDPDGTGEMAALIFAKVATQLKLSNTDFYIV